MSPGADPALRPARAEGARRLRPGREMLL